MADGEGPTVDEKALEEQLREQLKALSDERKGVEERLRDLAPLRGRRGRGRGRGTARPSFVDLRPRPSEIEGSWGNERPEFRRKVSDKPWGEVEEKKLIERQPERGRDAEPRRGMIRRREDGPGDSKDEPLRQRRRLSSEV